MKPIKLNPKTFSFLIVFVLLTQFVNAQNWLITGNAIGASDFLGGTSANTNPLIFKTNGVERMRLLGNNAYLGIGTTAPITALHVNGQSMWLTGGNGGNLGTSAGKGLRMYYDATNDYSSIFSYDYTAGVYKNLNLQASGGNVGIGTTAPALKLSVQGVSTANDGIRITQTGAFASSLDLYNSSTNAHNWSLLSSGSSNSQGAGNFTIYDNTAAVNRFFINTSGNIGVGTISPSTRLHIQGVSTANDGIRITQAGTYASSLDLYNSSASGHNWSLLSSGASNSQGAGNFTIYDNTAAANRFFINTNGNVGIGNINPQSLLDVNGTANISSSLSVGGNITATGNFSTSGSINAGSLNLSGNSSFTGTVDIASKNLTFGGSQARIQYIPHIVGGSNPNTLFFATDGGTLPPPQLSACLAPAMPNGANVFMGNVVTFGNAVAGGQLNTLAMGYDGVNGYMDLAGSNNNGDPVLLLDWYCGKDVGICTNFSNGGGSNANGGIVSVGYNMEVGLPWPRDTQTALNIRSHGATAISVQNTAPSTVFTVGSDGTTHIGIKKPTNAPYNAAMLTVDGTIVSKEIWVLDQQTAGWADYVFAKDYKLKKLEDVENFINQNKHLPNIPSAEEIKTNGQGLGKMQALQMEKIEELYLYVIDLNKKVEDLKIENSELKKIINNK